MMITRTVAEAVAASPAPQNGTAAGIKLASADDREVDRRVGERLRTRREALGLSQGALGRALGVTFSQVQKYEKGTNRIGAGRLLRAAGALRVPVSYFFEGIGEAAPRPGAAVGVEPAELQRLQEAYCRIRDRQARRAVFDLLASLEERGSARERAE